MNITFASSGENILKAVLKVLIPSLLSPSPDQTSPVSLPSRHYGPILGILSSSVCRLRSLGVWGGGGGGRQLLQVGGHVTSAVQCRAEYLGHPQRFLRCQNPKECWNFRTFHIVLTRIPEDAETMSTCQPGCRAVAIFGHFWTLLAIIGPLLAIIDHYWLPGGRAVANILSLREYPSNK